MLFLLIREVVYFMLKQDANIQYLAKKVNGYMEQDDKRMVERFIAKYQPIIGCTREELENEIEKLNSKTTPKKEDKKDKKEDKGDD